MGCMIMADVWNIAIEKEYVGKNRIFKMDVSIQSNAERLVLFGVSGSGKTQLLRMLSGLVRPDQGSIEFEGKTLFNQSTSINLSPQERSLAYVFQEYALFPHLTVMQNIAFSVNKGWLNKSQSFVNEDVESWLEKFELKNLAYQYPHQLSGGQSQRVALARALVCQPKALLLDEPFSALDDGLRKALRSELYELQKQLSIPMILISHNLDDVHSFSDELIQIREGRTFTE